MSMKTYAATDYGLYITTEDLQSYADKNNLDVNDVGYDYGFNVYSDADGECFLLMQDEHDSFDVEDYFMIAPLEKYPSLFKQAYLNKEEALQELKNNYGEFLPDDFDYEGKFVHYVGTTFG